MIIIINGSGGAGKDTFVEYCAQYTNVMNVSAVDLVKEAAKILGWQGEKDEKARKMLSDIKSISINYNDGPTNYIVSRANEFQSSDFDLMFVHIREPEEIEKAKILLGAKTLLVKNSNKEIITSNESDRRVEEYNYDFIIDNSGSLEALEAEAKKFVNNIGLEKESENRIKQYQKIYS